VDSCTTITQHTRARHNVTINRLDLDTLGPHARATPSLCGFYVADLEKETVRGRRRAWGSGGSPRAQSSRGPKISERWQLVHNVAWAEDLDRLRASA
jgi:hypothetical protein